MPPSLKQTTSALSSLNKQAASLSLSLNTQTHTHRAMEALLSQFSLLSHRALVDKTFDPSAIEDLMKLFEIESYNAWAALELQHDKELLEAEISLQEAEDYLDSVMDEAEAEFDEFEAQLDGEAAEELRSLVEAAESSRRMGRSLEKAAAMAAKKYIEAAAVSAAASMKTAWKGLASAAPKKVHPNSN